MRALSDPAVLPGPHPGGVMTAATVIYSPAELAAALGLPTPTDEQAEVIAAPPGPLVVVNARAPFQDAPMTIPMAASSSSACTIAYRFLPLSGSMRSLCAYFSNAPTIEVEGVMGYQAATVAPP